MRIEQVRWDERTGWTPHEPGTLSPAPQLVLAFGSSGVLQGSPCIGDVVEAYPHSVLFGCSTAGEICGTRVSDESLVMTAISFDHTRVEVAHSEIAGPEESHAVGLRLATAISHDGLRHAFALSDGLGVNGSDLVRGLRAGLPEQVSVTGGLSADGARFANTFVVCDTSPRRRMAGIIGLYGSKLSVRCASMGGWDPFG